MKKKKISYEETTTLIDKNGESRTRNISLVKVPQEPPYVKLYIDDITALHKLPSNCSGLLFEIVKLIDYSGEIIITKRRREALSEATGLSDKSIKNRITQLIDKGIMKRIAHTTYIMNPKIFAKGSWSDITKLRDDFELIIRYQRGKRTVEGREVPA